MPFQAQAAVSFPKRISLQGREAAKNYLHDNPEVAEKLEADIRKNFDRLLSNQARAAAKAAGRAVDVSADDFDDAD